MKWLKLLGVFALVSIYNTVTSDFSGITFTSTGVRVALLIQIPIFSLRWYLKSKQPKNVTEIEEFVTKL